MSRSAVAGPTGDPQGEIGGYRAPRLWRQAAQWAAELALPRLLDWLHRDLPPACRPPAGFAMDPRDHIGRRVLAAGLYEAMEIQASMLLTRAFDATGGIFIDVGAHMGTYAATLGRAFERVIAFEPNPRMNHLLRFNVHELPHIECRAIGLSDRRARLDLCVDLANTGHASLRWATVSGAQPEARVESVAVDTLDAQMTGMDGHVSFMKVDVEGHEGAVLIGARATLARDRPIVALEYVRAYQGRSEPSALAILRESGYRIFSVGHRLPFRHPLLNMLHRLVYRPRLVIDELSKIPSRDHRLVFAIPSERVTAARLAQLAGNGMPR